VANYLLKVIGPWIPERLKDWLKFQFLNFLIKGFLIFGKLGWVRPYWAGIPVGLGRPFPLKVRLLFWPFSQRVIPV